MQAGKRWEKAVLKGGMGEGGDVQVHPLLSRVQPETSLILGISGDLGAESIPFTPLIPPDMVST